MFARRYVPLFILAAVALAAFAAPSARASSLGYQGLAFTGGAGAARATLLASDAEFGDFKKNSGPVRRRSPRYEGYGPRPRTFATFGLGGYEPSDQPGNGLYVTGSVGTELQTPLDLGVSLSWYRRSTGGSQFVTTFEDPAGNQGTRVVDTDEITTDLVPLMAFLRVRFPTSSAVQPYVGGGIGWEWLLVEGVDQDGFAFSDDYDGFGAQLFGGVNLAVSPSSALYGEVLYNSSTVSADFYDPFFGTTVRDQIDMDGVAAHAGLRLRF
jgi:opacity protein-like surface antigen